MAIQQIQYENKETINNETSVPDKNKCKADDLNEIKSVVNNNSYETPKVSSQVDTDYKVNVLTTKNLFNKDNAVVLDLYFDDNDVLQESSYNKLIYIPCKPNTTYTLQKTASPATRQIGYTTEYPAVNVQAYGKVVIATNGTTGTITTGANAKYLVCRFYQTSQDTSVTIPQMLSSIQIEYGNTATTYEAFIPNTINVNNEKYTDTINVGTSINDKNRVNVLYSKNLLPYPYVDTTKTTNGITFTDNGDGTITISGTASANASFKLLGDNANQVEITANYVSGGLSANRRVQIVHYNPGYTVIGNSTGTPKEINKSTYTTGYVEIVIASGEAITTPITIKPMLTMKSDDVFEKYIGSPSINVDGEEIYNTGKDIITAGFSSDFTLGTSSVYTDVPTNYIYSKIGTNFEINNNEIICKKDGYIKANIHYNFLSIAGTGNKWITANHYHTQYNGFIFINATGTQSERLDVAGGDRLLKVYAGDKIKVQVFGTQNDTLRAAYSYITCEYV